MTQPPPPPGWYPDATNPALVRWWDGARWTEATQVAVHHLTGGPVRSSRTWPKVLGIVAAVVVGIGVLAAIGAAVSGESPTPTNSPTVPANFDASSFPTCSSLVPDIVKFINRDRPNSIRVLDIYRPKQVSNHVSGYLAGTYKIPSGEVHVTLLTCSGTALLANSVTAPLSYYIDVDLKGNLQDGYDPSNIG